MLTVSVLPEGNDLNGVQVTVAELEQELTWRLAMREDKTVVIIPHDEVSLGRVVEVLDVAKMSGAEGLALLNEIGR
jgi:biopolymer transport protein ExbD